MLELAQRNAGLYSLSVFALFDQHCFTYGFTYIECKDNTTVAELLQPGPPGSPDPAGLLRPLRKPKVVDGLQDAAGTICCGLPGGAKGPDWGRDRAGRESLLSAAVIHHCICQLLQRGFKQPPIQRPGCLTEEEPPPSSDMQCMLTPLNAHFAQPLAAVPLAPLAQPPTPLTTSLTTPPPPPAALTLSSHSPPCRSHHSRRLPPPTPRPRRSL